MLIQVNSDYHVTGVAEIAERIQAMLAATLERFANRLTRVELKDDNGVKGGARDEECTLEARLAGLAPIAVTQLAPRGTSP